MLAAISIGTLILTGLYLWRVNHLMHSTPEEARKLCQPPWTDDEIQEAYQKVKANPIDVKPFLFSRTNRRYVVTGGSGLSLLIAGLYDGLNIYRTCWRVDSPAPIDAR